MENLIGQPYVHGDYSGVITRLVEKGSFKGCYEVKLSNPKNNHYSYWFFQKHILHERYGITK